jgi:hypothetical protein
LLGAREHDFLPGGWGDMKTFILLWLALSSSMSVAAVTKAQIDRLATQFFMFERSADKSLTSHQCENQESGISCSEAACQAVGQYDCDDLNEIERIGQACRGNYDGTCVQETCKRLGNYNCDDISEIERVAANCRGGINGACLATACRYLGDYDCDDMSEIERVTKACRSVKASCIDSVCRRLGNYDCDDISEIERVAASCRGS